MSNSRRPEELPFQHYDTLSLSWAVVAGQEKPHPNPLRVDRIGKSAQNFHTLNMATRVTATELALYAMELSAPQLFTGDQKAKKIANDVRIMIDNLSLKNTKKLVEEARAYTADVIPPNTPVVLVMNELFEGLEVNYVLPGKEVRRIDGRASRLAESALRLLYLEQLGQVEKASAIIGSVHSHTEEETEEPDGV